jgi:aryl-alcohol dehydrogenase-like predicted oxidoreductase
MIRDDADKTEGEMKTIPLGGTGLQVSALCLGAMFFGTRTDAATSLRLLDAYAEAGGRFVDTANIYASWIDNGTGGESETLLGEWMRTRRNRAQIVIASKVGFPYPGVERGLRAAQIEAECDKSLKRLGVETIDLYYAHVDDRNTPLDETMRAFDHLVQAGKVRFIGASNYLAWRLEEARWTSRSGGLATFCCIQQRHTYLRVRPGASFGAQVVANEDLLDYCRSHNVTVLAYGALLGGAYSRADRPLPDQFAMPDNERRLHTLRAVADESGATVNQVILRWMLQSSPVVLPLIAASSDAQLAENLAALDADLAPAQMERLTQNKD